MHEDKRDWQRALYIPLTILAWLVLVVVVGWLLSHVLKTILTLILSGVVAFAIGPLVSRLSRWMPRPLSIFVSYLFGFAVVGGVIVFIVLTAASQITDLVHNLPRYSADFNSLQPQLVTLLHPFGVTRAKLAHAETQALAALQSLGTAAARDSVGIITGIVGTVIDIVLVLILSVYLTANGPKIVAWLRRETPENQRLHTTLAIAVVNQVAGGYVRGQLTLSLLIGFLVGAGTAVLQVPYAVLLGVLAFFMEFIPVIGVLVSGAVSVLLALTKGPILALIVLGYFVLIHVIEGDLVGPRIMGRAVGIHPATAIIALVAGTELFGVWGALLASPIAGMIQAIATAAWRELHGEHPQAVLQAVIKQEQDIAEAEGGEPPATPPVPPAAASGGPA